MQNYTFEKRDFTDIDRDVEAFNKLPRVGIIDNFNRRIDLDYITNSDMIEGEHPKEEFLLDILRNPNLKVLRSYPRFVINDARLSSGEISDRVVNISGMDDDEQSETYKDILRDTDLVVFDTQTNEEYHVKTTGHLLAINEVINEARKAKMIKQTIGRDVDLTAEFIADNVNCHLFGEKFGRYRSPWNFPVVGLRGVFWVPTAGNKVDRELEELLDWYNNGSKDLHPIERAAIFHAEFIRIHPFPDGNGRTGRLLVNYELVKNGYPTITIKASQRGEYVDGINEAILTGDSTKLVDLFKRRMESRLRLYNEILSENDMAIK